MKDKNFISTKIASPDIEKSYNNLLAETQHLLPLNKCILIRDWVCRTVPSTWDIETYLDDNDFVDRAPVLEVIQTLYENNLGLMCGGTSTIMARICYENNLRVIQGNFGNPDLGLTHMACIVKISDTYSVLMDPYWGNELRSAKNNSIIDYYEAEAFFKNRVYDAFYSSSFNGIKVKATPSNSHPGKEIIEVDEWDWTIDQRWKNYFSETFNTTNFAVVYFLNFQQRVFTPANNG